MIVIVDDDEGVREALRFSLATEGYAVRAFADAASVLNAELPAEGCLVFDYRLPGMNGLDLLAELRRRGVHLPAVLITSLPGKWLQLQESTKYESALKNKLPENYTIEFDALFEFKDDQFAPWVSLVLLSEKLPGHAYGGKMELTLAPNNGTSETRDGIYYASLTREGDNQLNATKKLVSTWSAVNHKKMPVHVAIWVQKQRFRAWLNQEKVYDLPRGVGEEVFPNQLGFEVTYNKE